MSSADLLKSIPELVQKRDAAALAGLRDHPDKDVRKAVRKALHTLKSKGIDVPEGGGKAWTLGDGLQSMRGDLQARASLDAQSMPGALRFVLSEPDEEGARLLVGTLGPDDRVLEFGAYRQTDGQRTRLLRDWTKTQADRTPPVSWLKARIRYARERTIAGGFSVPRALDELLGSLGGETDQRPPSFLGEVVAKEASFDPSKAQEVLDEIRFDRFPPLATLDGMLQKAAEIHGDNPQPQDDDARMGLIADASKDDEGIRAGLAGPIANALEDTAADAWLHGRSALAASLFDMVTTLRSHAAPETLPWAHRILGYQVASLLRAVTRGQVPGMSMDGHGHDHDHDHDHAHDHDHDHDHGHVHDENCDHDHEHR